MPRSQSPQHRVDHNIAVAETLKLPLNVGLIPPERDVAASLSRFLGLQLGFDTQMTIRRLSFRILPRQSRINLGFGETLLSFTDQISKRGHTNPFEGKRKK